ncbi:unnamed protein product, partial [Polarella glacialis]
MALRPWSCSFQAGSAGGEPRSTTRGARGSTNNNDNNKHNKDKQIKQPKTTTKEVDVRGAQELSIASSQLQKLVALGTKASLDEVSDIFSTEFCEWKRNPKRATVVLSCLAKQRLPHIARHVLTSMLVCRADANVFHYNAVISASGKGGQWQLALSLLSSMSEMRILPDR